MRNASIERNTKETQISINLELNGSGKSLQAVELPFFAHMLDQIAKHGCFDIDLKATGDLEVDAHHTVEDNASALGLTPVRWYLSPDPELDRSRG